MTADERARQLEKFDRDLQAYDEAIALYDAESEKWAKVWRDAGREPPPTNRIKPKPPVANWGTCKDCLGTGAEWSDLPCRVCEGTGDSPAAAKESA